MAALGCDGLGFRSQGQGASVFETAIQLESSRESAESLGRIKGKVLNNLSTTPVRLLFAFPRLRGLVGETVKF